MIWHCRVCKHEFEGRDSALFVASKTVVVKACPQCRSPNVGTVKFKDPPPSVTLYGTPDFEGWD